MAKPEEMAAVQLPAALTPQWCGEVLGPALDAATRAGAPNFKAVLPLEAAIALMDRAQALVHAEPTLLQVPASGLDGWDVLSVQRSSSSLPVPAGAQHTAVGRHT